MAVLLSKTPVCQMLNKSFERIIIYYFVLLAAAGVNALQPLLSFFPQLAVNLSTEVKTVFFRFAFLLCILFFMSLVCLYVWCEFSKHSLISTVKFTLHMI